MAIGDGEQEHQPVNIRTAGVEWIDLEPSVWGVRVGPTRRTHLYRVGPVQAEQ